MKSSRQWSMCLGLGAWALRACLLQPFCLLWQVLSSLLPWPWGPQILPSCPLLTPAPGILGRSRWWQFLPWTGVITMHLVGDSVELNLLFYPIRSRKWLNITEALFLNISILWLSTSPSYLYWIILRSGHSSPGFCSGLAWSLASSLSRLQG